MDSGRIRRSTLERFNDELAVLDRPLEGDVEYYDEAPPSPWPRRLGFGVALFLIGAGGFLFLTRPGGRTPVAAVAIAAPQPARSPAPAATVPSPAAVAPVLVPMPAAQDDGDDEEAAEADAIPSDAPSVAVAIAPSAWTKIGSKAARSSGHTKRTRLADHDPALRHKPRHR